MPSIHKSEEYSNSPFTFGMPSARGRLSPIFPGFEAVVEDGELKTADEREIARGMEKASKHLASKAKRLENGGS
jgi:hypothetical protein